jgi:hypothetical protein
MMVPPDESIRDSVATGDDRGGDVCSAPRPISVPDSELDLQIALVTT